MTNRDRAYAFAKRISEVYHPDKVVVCWNFNMARKYGLMRWTPNTIAFACVYQMENGDDVNVVIPIARQVLFNSKFDFTEDLLFTVGRYIIKHYRIEQVAELMRKERLTNDGTMREAAKQD